MSKASDSISGLPVSRILVIGLGLVSVILPFVGWHSFSLSPTQMDMRASEAC